MKKTVLFITVITLIGSICLGDLLRSRSSEAAKLGLPEPNQLLNSSKTFSEPLLMGIKLNKDNPLNIDFIVDCADKGDVSDEESKRLVELFLVALTVPNDDYWVNLSPYESDRIIADSLAQTELGKELLAQDYVLKQLSSSLTFPETELGSKYWNNSAGDQYLEIGNKFTKVWIVPDEIEIFEDGDSAYIIKSSLEVMNEHDYLATALNDGTEQRALDNILPELRKQVNTGKHFASLRQLYRSMILAVWFKEKFKDSFYRHYINKNKVTKEQLSDKELKDRIYKLYCQAFEKGVYDLVKSSKGVKRSYFCGGVSGKNIATEIRFSSSVNDVSSVPHMGPVKTIKTALSASFAVGEKTTVDQRKEWPKDKVEIQGVESKSNSSNKDKREKETYNPYAKKNKPDQKGENFSGMASPVGADDFELIPLENGNHSNDEQLGGFTHIPRHDNFQEVQIDFGEKQETKNTELYQAKSYDLNKVLGNAGKIVNYLLGALQDYNRTRELDRETLQQAVSTFIELNQALVKRNNNTSYGVAKAYGVSLGASISSFTVLVEECLVKSFAARSFETEQYLRNLRSAYTVLEENTNHYIRQNGAIVSSSSVELQGGVDFKELELTTASSSIPVEIKEINFDKLNGFNFEIIAIDSAEDIV